MKKHKCIFDTISLVLTILSLAIATIALLSVTKVKGFEDLLEKTSKNTQNLNVMITKLEEQNSLQQKSIDNNKLELNELKKQTKTLLDLQVSDANQLELQKKEDRSMLIGDYLILSSIYWKLFDLRTIPDNNIFINESYREPTIQYLQDLKSIINEGINTKLLKMNDKIYSQWWVFYQQIDFTINLLNDEVFSANSLKKYYKIPLIPIERSYNGKIMSKKESDLKTLEDFKEYLKTFWIKGATPILEIKEMQYYYNKYQNLSNYGRIIKE